MYDILLYPPRHHALPRMSNQSPQSERRAPHLPPIRRPKSRIHGQSGGRIRKDGRRYPTGERAARGGQDRQGREDHKEERGADGEWP